MSGVNADCHVSTKWEDTGGKDDSECDANVLLSSPNTNSDSLQELIEKEFALRSSAVMNGVDRPKSLLICDTNNDDDDNDAERNAASKKVDAFDIFDAVTPVNGCKRSNSFKLTRGVAVAEVDDFDVLYSEVSEDELVSNGHVTLTGLLSPELELSIASSLSDDKSEGRRFVEENNESQTSAFIEVDSVGAQLLTSCSDETESSLDSVRMANRTNKSVDFIQPFDDLTANTSNNDFIPISEVDIIVDEQEDCMSRVVDGDHSTVSMSSMIDVQKVVENMEDSRHIIDNNDLISNARESDNQRKNNDDETVVIVTGADTVSDSAQQCHYKVNNTFDGSSVEDNNCDVLSSAKGSDTAVAVQIVPHCNGDIMDDVRDVLVLDEDSLTASDQPDFEMFEKGFERWSIETSNVAMIAATCEKPIEQINQCSYDLTLSCVSVDFVPTNRPLTARLNSRFMLTMKSRKMKIK